MKPPPTVEQLAQQLRFAHRDDGCGLLDVEVSMLLATRALRVVAESVPHLEYRKDIIVVISRHFLEGDRDDCRAAGGRCAWEIGSRHRSDNP